MALINNIGAGIFTTLMYKADTSGTGVTLPTDDASHRAFVADETTLGAGDGGFFNATASDGIAPTNVGGMREFPSFGAPANIVNVPVYGQLVSDQIGGQSDAPTLEFTVNYIPSLHAALQALVVSGARQVFQISLANAESRDDDAVFYIKGTVSSFLVSPNLTDSNQATISIATVGNYEGPFATTA